ncbi:MAG: hypothetical protein JO261_09325 [Alphaproteobacteria bacterium]|nr:hypothetical protein [Alphaproteobacteria bacterium]MBV9693891.1 hypothetical protein [Alphaproteobacteria bacterium]
MSDEVLRNKVDTRAAHSLLEIASSEPAFVEKWPLAWRMLFIFGGALVLWAGVFWLFRWIA